MSTLVNDIKSWARESLGNDGTFMVTELRCSKAECPSVETVIVCLDKGSTRRWCIHKPIVEVTREDVGNSLKGAAVDARVALKSAHTEE